MPHPSVMQSGIPLATRGLSRTQRLPATDHRLLAPFVICGAGEAFQALLEPRRDLHIRVRFLRPEVEVQPGDVYRGVDRRFDPDAQGK